jgi:hypothetical protein
MFSLTDNVLDYTYFICVLKNVTKWQKENFPWLHFVVDWLPLSTFDSHCQFAISFNDSTIIDVNLFGDIMTVTSFTDEGDYRCVNFASAEEFDLFLRQYLMSLSMKRNGNL